VHETAYAKLNLALHVRKRREDGYHELETLFAFVDQGDRLSVAPAAGLTLAITGPFAAGLSAGDDNLVLRAARALAQRYGVSAGAAFTLDKQLPVAAGIGGGSADAAAALRLCARLWDLAVTPAELAELAAPLGADVPACVAAQTCFGSGVGDKLTPVAITDLAGAPVLLVNPRIACPTGPVFKAWDGVDRGALDPADWRNGRNDLAAPAIGLHPEIAAVLAALRETGPRVARMSGSGATCFALFVDPAQRDAAAVQLAERHPQWWQISGNLR
jgi:4-diphosphocytidyl-2-C-methyl-D-erythritol kinase